MSGSSEGTMFAIALSPSHFDYYDTELLINARQTTDVTVSNSGNTEVVTAHSNSSVHFNLPWSMRTVNGIEDKGGSYGVTYYCHC